MSETEEVIFDELSRVEVIHHTIDIIITQLSNLGLDVDYPRPEVAAILAAVQHARSIARPQSIQIGYGPAASLLLAMANELGATIPQGLKDRLEGRVRQ
jgi:hypothetical protein